MIDEQYLEEPSYGSRRIRILFKREGFDVNRKRIQRLMRKMGIEAIYPKPKTTVSGLGHKIYPYLLRGMDIKSVNQVWSTDITYIPMDKGFMYLVAIMDWYSRYILSWKISNTMEMDFCIEALDSALEKQKPQIFNSDQGVQFTSEAFTEKLKENEIQISMDGKGRYLDNIFIERFWRSIKYENIYIRNYENGLELIKGVKKWIEKYNEKRPHQSLEDKTPAEIYFQKG